MVAGIVTCYMSLLHPNNDARMVIPKAKSKLVMNLRICTIVLTTEYHSARSSLLPVCHHL